MKMISSKAGTRMAKAKAALDGLGETIRGGEHCLAYVDAVLEYEAAADAVADELIADRHHLQEGD